MHYAILTTPGKGGLPFKTLETAPEAPGDPLRVSENATLLAFENQPTLVIASQFATTYGKLLWHVPEQILHPDDLPARETFKTCQEFMMWMTQNGR